VIIVVAIVLLGRGKAPAKVEPSETANTAKQLIQAGSHKQAADLLEKEVADAKPHHGSSFLLLGHARFALGRRLDAFGAYERALRATPELGTDKELRANLTSALDGKDELVAVLALELMAVITPQAREAIIAYASTGKLADARHRALLLAEREGLGDKVDRVESWSLDLQQTTSCDERKDIIEKLAATNDKRALNALKRAKGAKCVEREAAEAIAKIESAK
jgi:tetratricopeptide (TPR) repeat protein